MKVQPRQQILEIWASVVKSSFRDGKWSWGGRQGTNSISDAEQLLCLMFPASKLPGFNLGVPDKTAEDVLEALALLGDSVEIPKLLLRIVGEYLHNYTGDEGRAIFSGGSYYVSTEPGAEPNPEQRDLDIVDSLSLSVTLMLNVLEFLKDFRKSVNREALRKEIGELERLASNRLTAAMVGLLRSFTVNVFEPKSDAGRTLIRTINQVNIPEHRILQDIQRELDPVRAGLRDLSIGSGQVDLDDNPNHLFECGWTWGVVKGAPTVETPEHVGPQPGGHASDAPILYFTYIALFGLADLFSQRTRQLGLLNPDQVNLMEALQRRWELTQSYWSIVAMHGRGRWPLEDIPWRTTDGKESDYYSLCVIAVVAQHLRRQRATDFDLGRVTGVLEELAIRGRITRRAGVGDPPIAMHVPGVGLHLRGSEELDGPRMAWVVSDFAVTLLKRTIWVTSLAESTKLRERLLPLAEETWSHLLGRRCSNGCAKGLWDHPGNAFPGIDEHHDSPSWDFTERVIEFLVVAAESTVRSPLHSPTLATVAVELLSEAELRYDQEMLIWSANFGPAMQTKLRSIQAQLQRARTVLSDRPGSSTALAVDALRELEALAMARENASEGA